MRCKQTRNSLAALLASGLLLTLAGCGGAVPTQPAPADRRQCVRVSAAVASSEVLTVPAPILSPWLLHLPGIGGKRSIDLAMTRGFKQGGFNGEIEIYDWTENDTGLHALLAYDRNKKEAELIARKITERFDKDPQSPIYLTCHSGGGGLAVWALEDLPARVKITKLIMMSPALSPKYDLTKALEHVSGKAYVFSSMEDKLVLGTGCLLMGTIDGVKTEAAGKVGFVRPDTADAGQYAKLVPMPYNPQWVQFDDFGNHVGGMTRLFAESVLAPLVLSDKLPPMAAAPTAATGGHSSQSMQ